MFKFYFFSAHSVLFAKSSQYFCLGCIAYYLAVVCTCFLLVCSVCSWRLRKRSKSRIVENCV